LQYNIKQKKFFPQFYSTYLNFIRNINGILLTKQKTSFFLKKETKTFSIDASHPVFY